MGSVEQAFVFGVDLDGVCADFYGAMRVFAAEWVGRDLDELPEEVLFGLSAWGLADGEYDALHRFAVTQRELFRAMPPIAGAPAALRRLSRAGVRIRIITHRLLIEHSHEATVAQTVGWLDHHGVPYWDLCFMGDKGAVEADLYIEDSPKNIEALRARGKDVIVYTNSTNRDTVSCAADQRADDWQQVERVVTARLLAWSANHSQAA